MPEPSKSADHSPENLMKSTLGIAKGSMNREENSLMTLITEILPLTYRVIAMMNEPNEEAKEGDPVNELMMPKE